MDIECSGHTFTFLFDGLFINYSFTLFGQTSPMEFLYSYISGATFHIDYILHHEFGPQTGYWDVDTRTRIMSNAFGGLSFGIGTHTPIWIFTAISISDVISIAVDAEGDHDFIVSGELVYNLTGFGLVDVWVLEDLTIPGGIAWYEKSTGILLNGTFLYFGGLYNYTFEIFDTNIEFTDSTTTGNGISGYNLLFIIALLGVTIVFLTKSKIRKTKN